MLQHHGVAQQVAGAMVLIIPIVTKILFPEPLLVLGQPSMGFIVVQEGNKKCLVL
jgi:hypothetical protein